MKISVITISYNAGDTIEETILSVVNQDYPDIEYVIIDGGSTDQTKTIISKYQSQISTYISEPDNGIYDAMNKGLSLATGDLIALLNADDVYAASSVLTNVCKALEANATDACYGDLEYVKRLNPDKVIRKWVSGVFIRENFRKGWMPPHPAFFVKRRIYQEFGNFNTDLKTSADYELMLRFLYRYKVSTCYLPMVLVKMKVGGQSNQSFQNRINANKEDRLAWKINNLQAAPFTFIMKPLRKVSQFWKR